MTSSKIYGRPSDLPLPPDDPSRDLTHVRADDPKLENIHLAGGTYTILVSGADTNGQYCLLDFNVPPCAGPGHHRHDFEEMFHILEGEAEVHFRGTRRTARAGETVNIPANAPHFFRNVSNQRLRILCVCSPAGQEDFFREVGTPAASRDQPAPKLSEEETKAFRQKAERLGRAYRTEFLPPEGEK